ncbi:hypothetical protein [Phocoenobacter skyensis]|uniref:Phage protein n=1 Tax=Phocoenobacter skyensis TaxID=97481 RepID=A0A1H7VAV5_9PAST|nr:hypothetical protein [Pasteurella skyensis]QLB23357.1 hypothetical protein A6B44_09130 [Pasteurella skyensis]SEM05907.1 hypothetical protein SAMN05444853_10428 [Pasteurella skyensis]
MKNNIEDLNNHLFAQLERLGDEDLTDEQLKTEIERTKAITGVAGKLIESANTSLQHAQIVLEYGQLTENAKIPKLLSK